MKIIITIVLRVLLGVFLFSSLSIYIVFNSSLFDCIYHIILIKYYAYFNISDKYYNCSKLTTRPYTVMFGYNTLFYSTKIERSYTYRY